MTQARYTAGAVVKNALLQAYERARRTIAQWPVSEAESEVRETVARLHRMGAILEMVRAPDEAIFYVELAEVAVAGAHEELRAARLASRCLATLADRIDRDSVLGSKPAPAEPGAGHSVARTTPRDAHAAYQRGLLGWLRADPAGLDPMHAALASLARALPPPSRSLWRLATLFVECLRGGLHVGDPGQKKLCGRIEQQMRRLQAGVASGQAVLVCDLVEHLAAAGPHSGGGLEGKDGELLGRVKNSAQGGDATLIAPHRERLQLELAEAKRAAQALWGQGGAERRPEAQSGLCEHLSRACGAATALGYEPLTALLRASAAAPPLALAAALVAAERACVLPHMDAPIAEALAGLAASLSAACESAGETGAMDPPLLWLVDPTAAAAGELLARIGHAEQALGEFFHDGSRAEELRTLVASLAAGVAVLRMLGLGPAARLAAQVQAQVGAIVQAGHPVTDETATRLAEKLCALGLYCGALAEGCALEPLELERLGLAEGEAVETKADVPDPAETTPPAAPSIDAALSSAPDVLTGPDEEPELLATFIEESDEVSAALLTPLQQCRLDPSDLTALREVRRGFHTLKGSSRMVGLTAFGEAAWAMEVLLNDWLAQRKAAIPALLDLVVIALGQITAWTEALRLHGRIEPDVAGLLASVSDLKRSELEGKAKDEAEAVVIGSSRIPAALFAIFQREAEGHHHRLLSELDALSARQDAEVSRERVRAAHTLASISRAVGLDALADLAGGLERCLEALSERPERPEAEMRACIGEAVSLLGSMLASVGQHREPAAELRARSHALLAAIEPELAGGMPQAAVPLAAPRPEPVPAAPQGEPDEAALWSSFLDEAAEGVADIGARLRAWRVDPRRGEAATGLLRLLHNLKGSAHTAGAPRVGALLHGLEGQVEETADHGIPAKDAFDALDRAFDELAVEVDRLGQDPGARPEQGAATVGPSPVELPSDGDATAALRLAPCERRPDPLLRLQAGTAERLLNQAAEVSVGGLAIEAEGAGLKRGLGELAVALERLRAQQRELEVQTEVQLQSRLAQLPADLGGFDPIELDRYTRVQEISRAMEETVSDSEILQRRLAQALERCLTVVAEQRQLHRRHHEDLMALRAIPLARVAERLHRVVRKAARDCGKQAQLVVQGGEVEADRCILDALVSPLEHLLRNAVVHGIEPPASRLEAGKPEAGEVVLSARWDASGVTISVADDGAGLDLARLRARAAARGLDPEGMSLSDERLMQLICARGVSTAPALTGLAGRGLGLDAVLGAVSAVGGRIEVKSETGAGTCFSIAVPFAHSIAHAVLVRVRSTLCAIPSVFCERVLEAEAVDLDAVEAGRPLRYRDREYQTLPDLARLLGDPEAEGPGPTRGRKILLLSEADEHAALAVDEVLGSRELVVKGVGALLDGVAGILGATALGDGRACLIVSPFQLARGHRAAPLDARAAHATAPSPPPAPLIMVVDDSVTVRRFTERFLARHGYRVTTARDGLEALEQVARAFPDAILLDIEMPRMDGFELTRKLKQNPETAGVPIIMVTSRTAEKHRSHALGMGVHACLGKPFGEQELLTALTGLVQRPAA